MKRLFTLAAIALLAGVAHAQTAGVVNLAVTPASGNGSVTPTATWSTTPAAASCAASGAWSGAKAASGTQALPAVTANASYTLTCTWAGTPGGARVTWTAPTLNTDGSPLTDLAGFRVMYGRSATALDTSDYVTGATVTSRNLTGLASGTWYFAVRAVNSRGLESDTSNIASKVVTATGGGTASATASVTVNAVPAPPTGVAALEVVAGVPWVPVYRATSASSIGTTVFGMVPVGRRCGVYVATWRGFRWHKVFIERNELWATTDPGELVAPCARA